jgi:acetylornithine deacetylase/succinyl-diaminopimelate desuccinylase-like protein
MAALQYARVMFSAQATSENLNGAVDRLPAAHYTPAVSQERSIPQLDSARARQSIAQLFEESIVPKLVEYIKIPNKSPFFDPAWRENGHMDRAVALVESFCRQHLPRGAQLEVVRLPQRTPLLYMEVPGTRDAGTGEETVLLYGHLDKQPEMVGWAEDLGPWKPVRKGDRLYGRGSADDGYAAFASLAAIRVLQEQNIPHARLVMLIEACEESGSFDLPHYIEHLAPRIGQPSLVVCLDSGCGNYEQLWCTTSLRGMITGTLSVELLREGVHSGDASGIVASSFRVLRMLLDRLEDSRTGEILMRELHTDIPAERIEQARLAAGVLGEDVHCKFPFHDGVKPVSCEPAELILNRTWRPALAITGAEGLPALRDAGNVMRPVTALKLSLRLPPTIDADAALPRVKSVLESDPPYGARVRLADGECASGWNAPPLAPWLSRSLEQASQTYFGRPAVYMGEGGSIPFMGMLGRVFPEAQFVITGVLGPYSNAHGPNEFLHLPTAERVAACVAQVVRDHHARR